MVSVPIIYRPVDEIRIPINQPGLDWNFLAPVCFSIWVASQLLEDWNSPQIGGHVSFRACFFAGFVRETCQVDHDLDELPEEVPEEPRQPTPALPAPPMAPLSAPFLSALTVPSPEEDEEIPEASKGSNPQKVGGWVVSDDMCDFFGMEFGN